MRVRSQDACNLQAGAPSLAEGSQTTEKHPDKSALSRGGLAGAMVKTANGDDAGSLGIREHEGSHLRYRSSSGIYEHFQTEMHGE
jgi:hypothetical protein